MALEAIQCLGGNGYINDYPTGRLLRDAKLYEIGAGTSEIRRWLIGRSRGLQRSGRGRTWCSRCSITMILLPCDRLTHRLKAYATNSIP